MPARKQPQSLEALSLESLGGIFCQTCERIAEQIVAHSGCASSATGSIVVSVEDTGLKRVVKRLQEVFLDGSVHYFHKDILRECMVSITFYRTI